MARVGNSNAEVLVRLKRKVVFLSVCIVFGLLFSKPAHQLAQTAVDRAAAFLGIQSLGFNSTVAVDDNVNNGKSDDPSRTTKAASKDSIKDEGAQNSAAVMSVIFDHCLPKLVCQLYSLKPEDLEKLSDQEQHLMNMIGSSTISATPTKFHHAANFGQMIRGVEAPQSCQNFYPQCPFTGEEVRNIAAKKVRQ